jgi:hypothetical protein
MTDNEKYNFLKKMHPNKSDVEIRAAVKEFKVLEGGLAGGQIAKALLNFGKSIFTKKAKEEGVKTAAKMSLKKKAAIGAVGLYAGSQAAGAIGNAMGGKKDEADTSGMTQAELDMANAVAAANAAGLDVNSLIASPAGTQLNLNANNLPAFMAKFGQSTAGFVGIGNVGIFTGVEIDKEIPRRKFGGTLTVPTKELVQLPDWNKRFPVDAAGLASTKQKFVDAGVLAPTDGIDKIKAAWEAYGKMSLEYSRAGHNVSPWELLALQKGLSGSGSQTTTTIDVSPIAETDIKNTAKRQLAVSLGLANIDDAMYKDIVSIVRKNEAKRPTKTVRTTTGNTTKVKTTPGYGTSDVLADVEEYAKKDPRYAEFQTADVFGNAMIKALGLKA